MPLFVYKCPECGLVEERFRRIEDRNKEIEEPHIVYRFIQKTKNGFYTECGGKLELNPVQRTSFYFKGGSPTA